MKDTIYIRDSIDDTLDYKKITKSLIAFIESSEYKLIEALGEGIVDHLKSKFGIKKVKLRLSKPGALRFSKDVGIMIER
jgi:dihydroneopterin aldolase